MFSLFLIGAATIASVGAIAAASSSSKDTIVKPNNINNVNNINYYNSFNNKSVCNHNHHTETKEEINKEELVNDIKNIFKEERELDEYLKELDEKIAKFK